MTSEALLIAAPLSRSSRTIFSWPLRTAVCSGVKPSQSITSKVAPLSRRSFTTS
ncbi:hypothetical protein F5Y04DRAFT_257948 [Hypomontagnella monticulosa]|nr:hypothetical protein F5Y04DRAFT_257948 [Hypomontagnella monticulosa]